MGYILATIRIILLVLSLIAYLTAYSIPLVFSKDPQKYLGGLKRRYSILACFILGLKLHFYGEENLQAFKEHTGAALVIGNHRSFTDPFLVMRFINVRPLSKASVSSYPIVGLGARLIGVIFVERDVQSSRKNALISIEKALKEGDKVLLFPEGTTSISETTREFRAGAFHTAADLSVPILPFTIHYEDDFAIWNDLSMVAQFYKHFKHLRTHVHFNIGKLYTFNGVDIDKDIEVIRNQINENILHFRSLVEKKKSRRS